MKNKKIAIIGAGISGLTIAQKLAQKNEVIIFDKSRGIGGRMATRRADNFHFDHGAQFFTAKSEQFQEFCQNAYREGVIDIWNARFAEIIGHNIARKWRFDNKQQPHYIAVPQMNNLCKFMAKNLDLRLKEQIIDIEFINQKWSLKTKEKEFIDFDYLILAIPSHQAVNLLPRKFIDFDIVQKIEMLPCFSLMIGLKEKLNLDFDAALVKESIISWISVNNSKKGRPDDFALLVNSSNDWAKDNLEGDLDLIQEKLLDELQKITKFNRENIEYINIHRWRYANANFREAQKSLFDDNLNLGICGDYFLAGRVENGFLSALDLYNKIT
ncbi:FAD-dependent oxidoreductase [Rickettsiales bacterium]|nr:FAD-dependent oxidoreductase [Rickettsiales bacterium]MDB2550797.1 FAD-dependent oxidoreductase [Rickettsiales bacterium]